MHVVVLGAGVVGVSTAYYLSRNGHRVTLLERAANVAQGASHANGGQLSYSFTDAMARPALFRALPGIALHKDPAMHINAWTDPAFLAWGARFLAECTGSRARRNTRRMLRLALRSRALLSELERTTQISFDHQRAGKLVLLRNATDLDNAAAACAVKRDLGCDVHTLSLDEATHIEPAIGALSARFVGAVYAQDDAVADARLFCENLSAWLQRETATTLHLGHTVTALLEHQGRIVGIQTDKGDIDADAAVVCLGAHSPQLLRPLGLRIPVYPVRGYSVTLETGTTSPQVSLTDLSKKIVFSRIGQVVRVAGLADFVGFDDSGDGERIARLLRIAKQVAPEAANYASSQPRQWGGMRPMTPTGYPCLGPTRIKGLHLNTGHGMLGWTTACASAAQVADQIGSSTRSSDASSAAESLCEK